MRAETSDVRQASMPRAALGPWLAVAALYIALVLIYAAPLMPRLASSLPLDSGDPGLNTWILWWNAQALPLSERWWNAPMFFPERGVFALSETLLALTPLTTPLLWLGAGPVLVYNLVFLASFPAAALAAHALAYRLTGRHDAALLAGLAFGFSPYRAAQAPHLQMLWSCWMPLALLALHRYQDTGRRRFLALAGACWLLNGLTSGYYLVFFAVLVGFWLLWFARSRRDWLAIGASLALASVLLLPMLAGYTQRQQALGLARDSGEIDRFAADLSGAWAVSQHVTLPRLWTFDPGPEGELYPGAIILVLAVLGATLAWVKASKRPWSRWRLTIAIVGGYLAEAALLTALLRPWHTLVFGLRISITRTARPLFMATCLLAVAVLTDARTREAWRRRSLLFFYTAAAVLMLAFALGPIGRLFNDAFWPRAPYSWLMELPGGDALRVPARFGMLFMLCLGQAAALGFARLTRGGVSRLAVAALAAGICLEGWPFRLPIVWAPVPVTMTAADPGASVLELPMRTLFSDTAAMLRATGHGLPTVNGFSGYFPPHYVAMREGLQAHDVSVLDTLRRYGPLFVLINSAEDRTGREEQFVTAHPEAALVNTTDVGPLYRLPAGPRLEPAPEAPLAILSVTVSVNPDQAVALTDNDLSTRWNTGPQVPDDQMAITLARPARMTRLDLDLGRFRTDYPRGLRIEVGRGDAGLVEVWRGGTGGPAIAGILADRVRATLSIPLPEAAVGDRLVLTQTGEHAFMYWSVAELRVHGREP